MKMLKTEAYSVIYTVNINPVIAKRIVEKRANGNTIFGCLEKNIK